LRQKLGWKPLIRSHDEFQHSPRSVAQILSDRVLVVAGKVPHQLLEVETAMIRVKNANIARCSSTLACAPSLGRGFDWRQDLLSTSQSAIARGWVPIRHSGCAVRNAGFTKKGSRHERSGGGYLRSIYSIAQPAALARSSRLEIYVYALYFARPLQRE